MRCIILKDFKSWILSHHWVIISNHYIIHITCLHRVLGTFRCVYTKNNNKQHSCQQETMEPTPQESLRKNRFTLMPQNSGQQASSKKSYGNLLSPDTPDLLSVGQKDKDKVGIFRGLCLSRR